MTACNHSGLLPSAFSSYMLRSSGRPCCLQLLNKQRRCRVALAARFADTTWCRGGGRLVGGQVAAVSTCMQQHVALLSVYANTTAAASPSRRVGPAHQ
jgi:hypothetical protein